MRRNTKLVAAAGEHYVAYALASLGYIAALVREGSPTIDVLASSIDGARTVGIQVKTTEWAERTRGRGKNKVPHELQFPLGHHAVETASSHMVFCFVDLRGMLPKEPPRVYVVPAQVLMDAYAGVDVRQWKYFRLHWPIARLEPYRDNWAPVVDALSSPT